MDKSTYPILIDQPEDDLDAKAIYKELVEYIKEKKKLRQIIIVTHNPNIVIGADAEQIIIANELEGKDKEFEYIAGSIENPDIKDKICQILEGGETAFKNREKRYGLE